MELTARRHPLSRLGAGPRARVLLLSSFCLIAAVDLWVLVARHARDVRAPLHLRWWLLAALFCLSEVFVVHVQWRSEAHTLSLSEVPLILGLFFASPAELVVGQTVGALVGLAVVRRQGIEKLTFNVANLALGTALAVAVFSRVFDAGHPLALRSSAAALVAAVVASAATVLLIYVAMMLVAGRSELGHLPQALAFGLAVTATNGCLGVLAVTVLWRAPTAVWLLVVPAAAAYYSYRALSAQHERRRRVEVLYETTRIIHEAVDIESAMQALLTHQRDLFRAATAEIVIAPTARGGTPLRMGQADRDGDGRLRPGPGWTAEESALWELVLARSGALLLDGSEPVLAAFSTSRRFADGMVVALRGESRPIGMMLVADRLGAVAAFDENDLALFDTVAGHLSTALEHGRLEHSLEELRRLEEQLAYQAREGTGRRAGRAVGRPARLQDGQRGERPRRG